MKKTKPVPAKQWENFLKLWTKRICAARKKENLAVFKEILRRIRILNEEKTISRKWNI